MICRSKMLRVTYLIFLTFFVSVICITISFDIEELKHINYEVEISLIPKKREAIKLPNMHMTSRSGQEFQCLLPELKEEILQEEVNKKDINIPELLKPMKNRCLLKITEYWIYEFCFGQFIKQFHVEDDKVIGPIITLGIYDSDYVWKNGTYQEKFKDTKQRYHSQFYSRGTKCDLTGKPRTTEVRFYCEEDVIDRIFRVDEPETCNYIITVHTAKLCSHPLLKPLWPNKAHSISCHPLLSEEQYSNYLQNLKDS